MSDSRPLLYRVLNVARGVAGAYATRLLADLGARCTWLRWEEPGPGAWPSGPAFRAYFERAVELLPAPTNVDGIFQRLEGLVGQVDLVIGDFTKREAGAEGTLFTRLRPFNPQVVIGNADHFGRSGPYALWAGDELTDYAMGGYWALAGDPAREPLRVPGHQAQFHAGLQLAIASLAALRHARLTGEGQEVNVTAVEAMLGAHWSTTVAWSHEGRVLKRTGCDLFEARDGWVFFYSPGIYQNLFLLIDRPDLIDDPRWATVQAYLANAAELNAILADWCRDQSAEEVASRAQELRIPVTAMATAASLLAEEHLQQRGYFVESPEDTGIRFPGLPYRWNEGWPQETAAGTEWIEVSPPRRLAAPVPITATDRVHGAGPLAGLRVIEVTNNWAGPICGRHLADLGAEVVKVELASKPATRLSHYPGKEPGKYHWNRSGYFNEMNRNKRDLALNLAAPRGRDLFLQLARWADVVVENNSARVMPNLGLGHEALRQVNPRLVMASISGFGATGPKRDWVAYGSNIEAASGLAAMTGYEGNVPYRTGSFVADPIAGAHAAVGILAALERRDRTGAGAQLDISLTESAIPFMLESLTYFAEHGTLLPRRGNAEPEHAPTGAYRCAGTDDWVAIAVRTEAQWRALSTVIGIAPADFDAATERVAHRAEVDALVSKWTAAQEQYECVRALQSAGVPAAPILHNWQLHSDPHLYARNAFIPIEHPDTGVLPYPGFPWRFSLTPPSVRSAAPRFAEANGYVFGKLLGLSEDEIVALYAEGVTANTPEGLAPIVV